MQKQSVLIVAEQPWQIELAGMLSQKLRLSKPEIKVTIAATDYYTFLHDPNKLHSVSTSFDVEILTLEELYQSWQSSHEPNIENAQEYITTWAHERRTSRNPAELARTNQLIYGWERDFFALPISDAWKTKVFLDSIEWAENLISIVQPEIVVSIERNTLCNNLIFEISKSEGINHVTFIVSRFESRWIPHLNFGLGRNHPLSKESKLSASLESRISQFHQHSDFSQDPSSKSALYSAAAGNLQSVMNKGYIAKIPYIFGKDLTNGVSNFSRLFKQIILRIRYRKNNFRFSVLRLEQNFFKLSIWELRQVFLYQMRLLGLNFWGIKNPPEYEFFFWALHSRPEDSTAVLGFGLDECQAILDAALQMPPGVKLLVKEHPIMFGVRSRDFYKKLRRIQNVVLVDAFSNTHDFVESHFCRGVIGISGTILMESEFKGTPAYALGSPEFRAYLSSATLSLGDFIKSTPSNKDSRVGHRLNDYRRMVMALSTADDVPYLHDLRDSRVGKMLESWTDILVKGGFGEK